VFRRRRKDVSGSVDSGDEAGDETADLTTEPPEPGDDSDAGRRAGGPWDVSEVTGGDRVDLGGLRIAGRPGMELRLEVAEDQVVSATAVLGNSGVQLQAFAAPRTEGIWADVRREIAAEVTAQGGTAEETTGPLGTELRARVPVSSPDGSAVVQPIRFVGVDGPRWFLRGVVTGRAAVDPHAAADVESLFRDVVVVRGSDPMPPREPIPLRMPAPGPDPGAAEPPSGPRAGDDLAPFERGPEITEIR
jgi:Protein of unknown function (DUF3710)